MGDFVPVDLILDISIVKSWMRRTAGKRNLKGGGPTSFRHFWLRMAYKSRVVAVSLAMVLVLRRLASLNDVASEKDPTRASLKHAGEGR